MISNPVQASHNPNPTEPLFLLVGNGSYHNRGCEAITRGTTTILRHSFGSQRPRFVSIPFSQAQTQFEESDPDLRHDPISIERFSPIWFAQNSLRLLRIPRTWVPKLGRYLPQTAAVLALGGDNYSMDYSGSLRVHLSILDYVRAHGRPMVLWGASVGPFTKRGPAYEQAVLDKLRQVDVILVREGISEAYLAQHGIEQNVRRVADPAFLLKPQDPGLAQYGIGLPQGAIGLNFSPLMVRFFGGDLSACIRCVQQMVGLLIATLDRPVVLVPHVMAPDSNDYALLKAVASPLQARGLPITLLPAHLTAAELKWVLGQLAGFAGARTHATIAALSSGVPTLSFAYSIKAHGINRDLFGHEAFVLAAAQITPERVVQAFKQILAEETAIRTQLVRTVPIMQTRAQQAGAYLSELLRAGRLP